MASEPPLSDYLVDLAAQASNHTMWTAEQWETVFRLANMGMTAPTLTQPETSPDTKLLAAVFPDLRLGWDIVARREGNNPVEVHGKIYDIRSMKITFDPQGRFYLYAPGWKFYREVKS